MEDCSTPVQCFLLIIHSKKFKNRPKSGSSKAAGKVYALLSTSVTESDLELYQLFMESDVEVLSRPHLPALGEALQRDQVEVVELLLIKNQGSKCLQVTVEEGNKALVKSILPHGYAVNQMRSSPSEICSAVDETNLELLETLLAAIADISYRNPRGGTLLHLAVDRNSHVLVKALLKHGASIDVVRNDGSTPLHLAVQQGNIEFVKLLLEKGADLHAKKTDGSTCLQIAAAEKHELMFELLLESGATLPAETSGFLGLLKAAVKSNFDSIIGKIFSERSISIPEGVVENGVKSALLLFAVEEGCPAIVRQLFEQGVDVNMQGPDGRTALEVAIDADSSEMVEIILQHRPDLGETELKNVLSVCVLKDDLSADINSLVAALKSGNINFDGLFLDADRQRARMASKIPVLNRAAEKIKDLKIIDSLVKYGADINIRDKKLETPLTIAVKRNSLGLIERLVKNGAHIDPEDEDWTPLEIALERDFLLVVEYLIRNNAKIGIVCAHVCPLVYAVGKKAVDMLLRAGASYDGTNIDGYSPLHFAAVNEMKWKFQTFLDHGFTNEKLLSRTKICDLFTLVPLKNCIDSDKRELMKKVSFKVLALKLARHMIKMEAAGLCYGEGNPIPQWYAKEVSKEDFRKNCDAEIARMKTQKVDGTEVSFYDILTGDLRNLTCYARKENIVKMLKAGKLIESFPIYGSIILCQLRKGFIQVDLLEKGKKCFHIVFKKLPKLPDAVVYKILAYLHNQEIMVLMTAVKPMAV